MSSTTAWIIGGAVGLAVYVAWIAYEIKKAPMVNDREKLETE